jgi:hypothetical protein
VHKKEKIFEALNNRSTNEDGLKNNEMSFKKRVFLRVAWHSVHSLSSSEPEVNVRRKNVSHIREHPNIRK